MKLLFKKQIIGSNPLIVRNLISEMMNCIKEWNPLDEGEYYEFRLVLNELISNGVLHGNKGYSDKKVNVMIEEVDSTTLDIFIKDEGQGFDYKSIYQHNSQFDDIQMSEGGRGLILVNALCSKIQFNERGNQIKITKSICPK
ncbi:MAG: ATP-binding protein [Clostridiales bacterium]|nr:ATP-binding protein [Clostridiales bacterium]